MRDATRVRDAHRVGQHIVADLRDGFGEGLALVGEAVALGESVVQTLGGRARVGVAFSANASTTASLACETASR
ncbi:hypothetical protein [Halorussus caseinilyticus]|uniref:Uncharacterized protein n=1 Tax=Halorussus caseinilyticus TaxID=3034025 RepID=A0ABD5WFR7_9EURY